MRSLDHIPDEEFEDPSDFFKYIRRGGIKKRWWSGLLSQLEAPGIASKRAALGTLKEIFTKHKLVKIPEPILEAAKEAHQFVKERE